MGLFDGWSGFDPKGLAAARDMFGFGNNGTMNPWLGAGLSMLQSAGSEEPVGLGGAFGGAFGTMAGLQGQRGQWAANQKMGDLLSRALFAPQGGVGGGPQVPQPVRNSSTPMGMPAVRNFQF